MRALLLPILLLAALPAFAAPLTFEEVDTDGDGLISADEAANVEGLDFNAADGDNDGTLSVDEYDIAIEKMVLEEEDGTAKLVVHTVFKDPQPGTALSQVLTYPFQVAETELTYLPDQIELKVKYQE